MGYLTRNYLFDTWTYPMLPINSYKGKENVFWVCVCLSVGVRSNIQPRLGQCLYLSRALLITAPMNKDIHQGAGCWVRHFRCLRFFFFFFTLLIYACSSQMKYAKTIHIFIYIQEMALTIFTLVLFFFSFLHQK